MDRERVDAHKERMLAETRACRLRELREDAAEGMTRHYRQAVMQAAIRINAEPQAKLGRMDVSKTALFNEAFSLNPPKPDAARLRPASDDGSKTYENFPRP